MSRQGALGRNDMPSFDTNETAPILYARMPIRNEKWCIAPCIAWAMGIGDEWFAMITRTSKVKYVYSVTEAASPHHKLSLNLHFHH